LIKTSIEFAKISSTSLPDALGDWIRVPSDGILFASLFPEDQQSWGSAPGSSIALKKGDVGHEKHDR
jgi:hypothetical protein